MDKYKLVPVEPSPEMDDLVKRLRIKAGMIELGELIAWGSDSALMREAANALERLAAPAVQVEPIGWYTEDHLDDKSATTYKAEVAQRWRDKGWPVWPLYAAPQHADQQPSADAPTPVPDELFDAEFSAWWEHHGQFCRAGGGTYEKSFAFEAWRHLYPQLMKLQVAAEEQQPIIPSERGKNRYGLDMSYFRNLFNRELNQPLVNFKPSELARVLARASRTADPKVMHETEFQIAEQKSAPDVNWLASIARDIVELHDRRGVVLTVHVEALKEALATHRKGSDV